MILARERKIYSSLVGLDARLSTIGLLEIVEDALTELMGELKVDGLTTKRLYNAFWVFTKNRIKLIRKPEWNETIKVESFISSYSMVKLNIDTALKDVNGNVVAYSRTELCALDLQTQRIRKVSTVGISSETESHAELMEIAFSKIDDDNMELIESVKARSTNIDFCNHVNNVEYVRFLLAKFTAEQLSQDFKEMQIEYLNQSFENDELDIYNKTQNNVDTFLIKRQDIDIVRCEICF